ncbi:MAG: hypothetical protein ISP37_09710 [Planktomarina sp.]|uniref:hypothetical protein n=1 Tax=Planktomarina sp. TaxID=2024851 RepID=UPI00326099EA|nr:hypothetical protein [Planktomarina sp.]
MALRIGNLDAFEAWLMYQPQEVAQVLAHRTAARMWPIIALDVVHGDFHGTWRANLTKSTLRSTLASRLMCIEPNAPRATAAARAAAPAADAAANASSSAADFASAAASADDVAGQAYVWESLSADVQRIEDGMRPADLVQAPLWPDAPMPRTLAENWQRLRDVLVRDDPNWQFWIDFYEGILAGGAYAPARIALMDKVAQMSEEIWEKPAREVNAHIAGMYQEFLDSQRPAAPLVDQRGAFLKMLLAEPLQTVEQADMLAGQIDRVAQAIRAESNTPDGVELFESMAMQMRQISRIVADATESYEDKIKALEAKNQALRDTIAEMVRKARNSDAPSPGDTIRQAAHELLVEFSKRAGQTAGFMAPVAGLFYLVGDADLVFQLLDAAQKFMPGKAGL